MFFCTNNAVSKSIILSCIIILCEKLKNYLFQKPIIFRRTFVFCFVIALFVLLCYILSACVNNSYQKQILQKRRDNKLFLLLFVKEGTINFCCCVEKKQQQKNKKTQTLYYVYLPCVDEFSREIFHEN